MYYINFKEKGYQAGGRMSLQMFNPKCCNQDKIEDMIDGKGVGCIMSSSVIHPNISSLVPMNGLIIL